MLNTIETIADVHRKAIIKEGFKLKLAGLRHETPLG